MTKYTVDVPDEVWQAWKETVPRSMNLNDGLNRLIAEKTLNERGEELDERTRDRINQILE